MIIMKIKIIFEIIYKYLINIRHKENIEDIFFNENFTQEGIINNSKYKTYIEILIDDYYKVLKNIGDINLNLYSLKLIELNDEKIKNNIQRFKIRYNLNKIFGFNAWCNLSIIKYKEFENIDIDKNGRIKVKKKAYIFRNKDTNLKILLIDLENNSPYQNHFYNFCKICLDNNPYINMLIFHNIGNNNYDEEFYKNIKNNPKIILPNLIQILYENNSDEIKEEININSILDSFFDCSKYMLYEGYNNNKNLIYYNATLEKIQENELNRIFLNENKIYILNLKYENTQIKYNRNDNHLIIKNNNKMLEQYVYYKPLKFFSEMMKNLKDLKKLTINGYNYKLSEINNPNISILSINSLNSFSINNCKRKNETAFNDNFAKFINLKYLIISGSLDEIKDIIINDKLKKIKFYAKDYDDKKVKKLEQKYKKKNINIEIINVTKNNKYENEEEIEKEYYENEENNEEKNNKNILIKKEKKIEKTFNIKNCFNSQILIENEQYQFLLKGICHVFPNKRFTETNFKRIYQSINTLDNITYLYSKYEVTSKFLIIIKTKEGNIFGIFQNKNNNSLDFIFNILTKEIIYGIFNIYKSNSKFYVYNHFYLVNNFLYSNNNKFFSTKLKMEEKRFTCNFIEIYDVLI